MSSDLAWRIPVLCVLILCSALCSGLTLGLLSLDLTDLKICMDSGSPREKRYAARIYPVRNLGNQLLVTLLIGNTAVNAGIAILSADIFTGAIGFLVSTVAILYLGEIIPQALCHRYGLVVGYYCMPFVFLLMLLCWPIAWPSAWVLNRVLGKENELRYNRREIKSLVTIHGGVKDSDNIVEDDLKPGTLGLRLAESAILGSALEFWDKKVSQVMTPLDRVFMLGMQETLDFETMKAIFQGGHSRLPVYQDTRDNVVGVIFAKDLILVDPDDEIPVKTLITFFVRDVEAVFEDATLGVMLNRFKAGGNHMAIVKRLVDDGERDPYYSTVGIITLEDVIEELIGQEIVDETDVYQDNTGQQKVKRRRRIDPAILKMFDSDARRKDGLTKNERKAITTFLVHNVNEFSDVREVVLRRLLKNLTPEDYSADRKMFQMIEADVMSIEGSVNPSSSKNFTVIHRGKKTDQALLVLQGKLKISAGEEGFSSEVGPWTVIAKGALTRPNYVPDFCAESLEFPLRFVRISRENYEAAVRLSDHLNQQEGMDLGIEEDDEAADLEELLEEREGRMHVRAHYGGAVQKGANSNALTNGGAHGEVDTGMMHSERTRSISSSSDSDSSEDGASLLEQMSRFTNRGSRRHSLVEPPLIEGQLSIETPPGDNLV
ncbi:Metal transporter CNNM2 [Porphyridium purpureum]|uniref:Metal transporter CNNM2 n=1 Tax=Porphyridium purpureum TaxID=35688 RepID=A0A5J4Z6F9_PORPP|nr:Metal transporter CNNM2 [Porphyridium purpureum]|eukprot:POR4545..scf295_1